MADVPRNLLGQHSAELIADALRSREEAVIKAVCAQLSIGNILDPQQAVQSWISIAEGRKLKATLLQRSRVETARIAAQN